MENLVPKGWEYDGKTIDLLLERGAEESENHETALVRGMWRRWSR